MKEKISDYLWAAFSVGILIGLFTGLLIIGKTASRMYQGIEANGKSILAFKEIITGIKYEWPEDTFKEINNTVQLLNERIEKLERKRWYSTQKR